MIDVFQAGIFVSVNGVITVPLLMRWRLCRIKKARVGTNAEVLPTWLTRLNLAWIVLPHLYWVLFGRHDLGIFAIAAILPGGWAAGFELIARDIFGFSFVEALGITPCPCRSNMYVTWAISFAPMFVLMMVTDQLDD